MTGKTILFWIVSYLIGAIPSGWIIVKLVSHRDIRYAGSGRIGMSNVTRIAGKKWGYLTALCDIIKGFFAVRVSAIIVPDAAPWVLVIAGWLAILGHIFSLFLIEKRRDGRFYLRGGAGGMPSIGAGIAMWAGYAGLLPVCIVIYLFTGITSIATTCFNIVGGIIFAIAAAKGIVSPWFIVYSVGAEIMVALSLIPNYKRLLRGNERKTDIRPN